MTPTRGSRLRALVVLLVGVLLAEGTANVGIQVTAGFLNEEIRTVASIYEEQTAQITELVDQTPLKREEIHPLLGWRYRPGDTSPTDSVNAQGLRASREYTPTRRAGVLRTAAFGDSYVYGNEVANADAWPAQLERNFPNIEVLNYGASGYGLDQAYLRYLEEGTALNPQVVLVGFVADDLRRLVNVYRRFLSTREAPRFKPRFLLHEDGTLKLVPNPVPDVAAYKRYLSVPRSVTETGVHDWWYEPAIYENPLHELSAAVRLGVATWIRLRRHFDPDRLVRAGTFNDESTAFAIQMRLFEAFAEAARERGMRLLVVFFPGRDVLSEVRAGGGAVYGPLVAAIRRRGIADLDFLGAFVEAERALPPGASLFMPGGHYSPSGNEVVARAVGEKLLESVTP